MVKRLRAVEGDPVPNMPFLHVAPGMCWVEGDNTDHSIDSRHFGMVSVVNAQMHSFMNVCTLV